MKAKIIMPVVAILVILASVTMVTVSVAINNLSDTLAAERIDGVARSASAYLDTLKAYTQTASVAMAASLSATDYLLAEDRAGMLEFLSLRVNTFQVDGFVVMDANGRVILRTFTPEVYGDSAADMPCVTAALEGTQTSAHTSNDAVHMAMSSASPIVDQHGGLKGVITAFRIMSCDDFVDRLGTVFNAEVTVFRGNLVAASTVRNVDGSRTTGLPALARVSERVLEQGDEYQTFVTLYEVEHHAFYFPLRNAGGEIIGMFFLGFSNEEARLATAELLRLLAVYGVTCLVLSVVILAFILSRVHKPLKNLTDSVSVIDDTNSRRVKVYGTERSDEIGLLSNTISDMLGKMEKANERILELLEKRNEAKSRFLARMSHEIRTPITAVMGTSEVQLRGREMPAHTEEAFIKIYEASKMLLNIVNDILDFSKIESGKMSLHMTEYDVANLANDVSQLHLVYLDNKNISFRIFVDEALPVTLMGDSLRIRQIINNLLTNAFKYTESGTVDLSLLCHENPADGFISLFISVKDTGMGMSTEQIDELQNGSGEYLRLHENEKPFISGTGLGLPIVYSMVQLMNADIKMNSITGMGTHITISIPQEATTTETIGKELAEKLQKFEVEITTDAINFKPKQMPHGKVLVVDDVDTNLYVAEAMLQSFGLSIELAESGKQAIEKIKQGNTYDVIFLDHMMPEMDGIEVAKILRDTGYSRPIVALTANAIKGQAEIFMENGFSGFMSKPIDIKILNSYLTRFVG
jgi:signal transduction histidine kinase